MAIENIPVWSFPPNWDAEVTESLEFFTNVLTSRTGAEQRRAHRITPRRMMEFELLAQGTERAMMANFITRHGGKIVYVPLWFEQGETRVSSPAGAKNVNLNVNGDELFSVGDVMMITTGKALKYELFEIASIESTRLVAVANLTKTWPKGSMVFRVQKMQMVEQPTLTSLSPKVDQGAVKFITMETNDLPNVLDPLGPLITKQNFYVAHSYHDLTDPTGRTEDHFTMAGASFGAYDVLRNEVGDEWNDAAKYYLELAHRLMDSLGDGAEKDPIVRAPISSDSNVLNLPNYRYAARSNAQWSEVALEANLNAEDNALILEDVNGRGNIVDRIWRIYPSETSELFFDQPWSPAFDIEAPTTDTSFRITSYLVNDDKVEIPIPLTAPDYVDAWNLVYSYAGSGAIDIGEGFKLVPAILPLSEQTAAYSGDGARFFDRALSRAIALDTRTGKAAYWTQMRAQYRRTDMKGRRIDDQRLIFEQWPGIAPLPPVKSEPKGFFAGSTHPAAMPPGTTDDTDTDWLGANFWTRDFNGDLVGVVPNANGVYRVQFGRVFADQWRAAAAPLPADQYLYVELSCSKKPSGSEFFLVWVSSRSDDDESGRWFANIGSKSEFVATPAGNGTVISFLIPRTDFRKRAYAGNGSTVWGDTLLEGQVLKSFGISAELTGAYGMRIRSMRLVTGSDAAARKGYPMAFAPGAAPALMNLNMGQQRFYDQNFSPLHGYQFPEFWKAAETEANAVFSGLTSADLPVPNRANNTITYPITGSTPAAMLMLQQMTFLDHAQKEWVADGGSNGPFAHTYTMPTYDRYEFVDTTQSKWVYENVRPYSQWGGFQYRIAEGLAQTIDQTAGAGAYSTARSLAVTLLTGFMGWLNVAWPNLNGSWAGFDGLRVFSGDESDYAHRFTGDENPFIENYSE